ncbi:MAG: hypothetical protein H6R01_130 [Burkholderiaceae bacterium]|nr:hypothetical protein [Burkholderiaceae bacterium]
MGIAKIVVSIDGTVTQEVALSKDRITIGRRPYNDVVLDNPAISGEHAVIVKSFGDCILEDLGSTNGTYVNGQPVKKHFLQNKDVIELMKYRIQFIDAKHADMPHDAPADNTAEAASPEARPAVLKVQNGSSAGTELALARDITTLGRAGIQLAAVVRKPDGYFIQHIEGENSPLVNDHPIGTELFPLMDGDVVNLSGTHVLFSLL